MARVAQLIMASNLQGNSKEKRKIVLELCAKTGIEFNSPKYDAHAPSFDLRETISELSSATIVIADVTFERPSCYFELGLAEAVGANIALIAQSGTDIHQTSLRDKAIYFADLSEFEAIIGSLLSDALTR